jgi:hypothetical protein
MIIDKNILCKEMHIFYGILFLSIMNTESCLSLIILFIQFISNGGNKRPNVQVNYDYLTLLNFEIDIYHNKKW